MHFYCLKNKRDQKEKSTVTEWSVCRDIAAQLKHHIPAFPVPYDDYSHTDL